MTGQMGEFREIGTYIDPQKRHCADGNMRVQLEEFNAINVQKFNLVRKVLQGDS